MVNLVADAAPRRVWRQWEELGVERPIPWPIVKRVQHVRDRVRDHRRSVAPRVALWVDVVFVRAEELLHALDNDGRKVRVRVDGKRRQGVRRIVVVVHLLISDSVRELIVQWDV